MHWYTRHTGHVHAVDARRRARARCRGAPHHALDEVHTYEEHEDSVYGLAWSAVDPWLFASLSYDGRVVINKWVGGRRAGAGGRTGPAQARRRPLDRAPTRAACARRVPKRIKYKLLV